MIGFLRWLRGEHSHPDLSALDAQRDEADEQRAEAAEFRTKAERLGPALRRQLRDNHFGERMAAALEPRGWGK